MIFNFENLFWSYDAGTPFEKIGLHTDSFSLDAGKLIGILGATGSGKSTFVKLISGLLDNKIRIMSDGVALKPDEVSYVFQQPEHQMFEDSVSAEMEFALRNFSIEEEQWPSLISKSLKSCGLDETFLSNHPLDLSGGQKRRVAIASVLVYSPKILILDEPLAGIDANCRSKLINMMRSYVSSETLVFWVSHDHEALLEWADQSIVFENQSVKFTGSVAKGISQCNVADPLLRTFLAKKIQDITPVDGKELVEQLRAYHAH
tara:strand:- start:808 stop:1590 length:783 start_codon:yes stop_codon:yes gene_type:complete